jgi:hypothetical protein
MGRSGALGVFDCRDPLCVSNSRTDAQPLGSLPGRRFANPMSAEVCFGLISRKAHHLYVGQMINAPPARSDLSSPLSAARELQ